MTTTNSRKTFLENLGLISGADASQLSRFESLNWDDVVSRQVLPGVNAKFVRNDSPEQGEEPRFTSYSGSDTAIYLLYDNGDTHQGIRNFVPFREIQTISISSARSVHPVRRLGESHVTAYTRGARTLAGSIVCVSGDRDPFINVMARSSKEKSSSNPFFTDEIPEFSILIIATNEYGQLSHAGMSGVTLTNFGQTFSSEDMYLENTYTYVARYYHPLLPDPNILNKLPYPTQPNKLSNIFALNDDVKKFVHIDTREALITEALHREHPDLFPRDKAFTNANWAKIQDWIVREQLGDI